MSSVATSGQVIVSGNKRAKNLTVKVIGSAAILVAAAAFVLKYVFRYYLHYNPAAFTDPLRGAANYWTMRNLLRTARLSSNAAKIGANAITTAIKTE